MSLYKGTHLIAGNDSVGIEKIIDQKLRERDEKRYYIGSIIIDTKNINPSDYLGFGTWEYFGEGKCLVGVDAGQTEFNTVEKTGGSKYLQKHNHEIGSGDGINSYIFGFAPETSLQVGPNHYYLKYDGTANGPRRIIGAKNTGNGDSENLQPYITVYIWKRIS